MDQAGALISFYKKKNLKPNDAGCESSKRKAMFRQEVGKKMQKKPFSPLVRRLLYFNKFLNC